MASNYVKQENLSIDSSFLETWERWRKKLLDFSARNPLISTRFSEKSRSIIQVIDEVPDILLEKLFANKMQIVALPPLEEEPMDEKSEEFYIQLAHARHNDEIYIEELKDIDLINKENENLRVIAERGLKDRIRIKLGLKPRQTDSALPSLKVHAKNHHIDPSYDLPNRVNKNKDGRHDDNKIQTLLLPSVMERKLKAILDKDRTFKEEAGIKVLHIAFGFLEHQEINSSISMFSPLLLLPIEVEKKASSNGMEFFASVEDNFLEENNTLKEKLMSEFSIKLPDYNSRSEDENSIVDVGKKFDSIENYIKNIGDLNPQKIGKWKTHNWVVIGLFPASKLSMYKDLDLNKGWDFTKNEIVNKIITGYKEENSLYPFAEEYNMDEPEFESKISFLITESDSSQSSVLCDLANGKNLAVEGPPGTGKSQTIVNAIANSLSMGKRILFVAEKSAALDVVFSRLKHFGLENFILPLQTSQSSKMQVMDSIRKRIKMDMPEIEQDLEIKIKQYKKAKDSLNEYINILSKDFKNTGKKVYQILGSYIKYKKEIDALPEDSKKIAIGSISQNDFEDILLICNKIEQASIDVNNSAVVWKYINAFNINALDRAKIINATKKILEDCNEGNYIKEKLREFDLISDLCDEKLNNLEKILPDISKKINKADINLVSKLNSKDIVNQFSFLIDNIKNIKEKKEILEKDIKDIYNENIIEEVKNLELIVKTFSLENLSEQEVAKRIILYKSTISNFQRAIVFMDDISRISDIFKGLQLNEIVLVHNLVKFLSREATLVNSKNITNINHIVIENYKKEAEKLVVERNCLKEKFNLLSLPSHGEIFAYRKILENYSIISIFLPKYIKAKRFYSKISNKSKFNARLASSEMNELYKWLTSYHEFMSSISSFTHYFHDFNGIDTNFSPYIEICKYFEEIERKLAGVKYSNIRLFLRSAESDLLLLLQNLDSSKISEKLYNFTCSKLKQMKVNKEKSLKELLDKKESVEKTLGCFYYPESLSHDKIAKILSQLEIFSQENKKYNENKVIKDWVSKKSKISDFNIEELVISLNLAEDILNFDQNIKKDKFLEILKQNKLYEFIDIFNQYKAIKERFLNSKREFGELTDINKDFWSKYNNYHKITEILLLALQDEEGINTISTFNRYIKELSEKGLKDFAKLIKKNIPSNVALIFRYLYTADLAKQIFESEYGNILTQYKGIELSSFRKQIKEIDSQIVELSRKNLIAKLYTKPNNYREPKSKAKSSLTGISLLKNEIEKKRQYLPIRKIIEKAGLALLEIKPCWIMSPLGVAQYIPKEYVNFDLVIIDEASQMTPSNAIGAIARGKQVMIVGDTNQLPPTKFFQAGFSDSDEESDEEYKGLSEESILARANALFYPKRRLRWHYRSKHPDLIDFSNKLIYDGDLIIFPTANNKDKILDMGVHYEYIDGYYKNGENFQEAEAVVLAIFEFMKLYPDYSLGVVTLNQKQRDLLNDIWEESSGNSDIARGYIKYWENKDNGLENFFIKNLENVQGDERDVIFISTVYGKAGDGEKVMQRFGPINGITGKNRLNVLFTRAKKRIVTFSSMKESDIIATENSESGSDILRRWLSYSKVKHIELGKKTNREPDSDFEIHVMDCIKSFGCQVEPQVGASGYYIDIGVKHPNWPHGFIMGIECDGASYHSSKSARDRDKLRQKCLEDRGWFLYRIWSTDWFDNPIKQTQLLREEIKKRLTQLHGGCHEQTVLR